LIVDQRYDRDFEWREKSIFYSISCEKAHEKGEEKRGEVPRTACTSEMGHPKEEERKREGGSSFEGAYSQGFGSVERGEEERGRRTWVAVLLLMQPGKRRREKRKDRESVYWDGIAGEGRKGLTKNENSTSMILNSVSGGKKDGSGSTDVMR